MSTVNCHNISHTHMFPVVASSLLFLSFIASVLRLSITFNNPNLSPTNRCLFTCKHPSFVLHACRSSTWWSLTVTLDSSSPPFTKSAFVLRWMADPCRTPTRSPAVLRLRNTVPVLTAPHFPLRKRWAVAFGRRQRRMISLNTTAQRVKPFFFIPLIGHQKAELGRGAERGQQGWGRRQETRHLLLVVPQQELREGPKEEGNRRY